MNATDLLAEITLAFQDEPYPGELNIIRNNFSDDLEVIQIRDSFKVYTWQNIPDELLQYEQGGYVFLSARGLRYYLPAYMRYCVREYAAADSIPSGLAFIMKLPTEVDIMRSVLHELNWQAIAPPQLAATKSERDYFQSYLRDLNETVHRFIDRWHQFSLAQSRAILHFLEYLRDEHGQDYSDGELDTTIERYWFQFAS